MSEAKSFKSMMEENRIFNPPAKLSEKAWIKSFDDYKKMWERSINEPEAFWADMANKYEWFDKWTDVRSYDFTDNIDIKWFEGGTTNITVNCLDRHVKAGDGNRVAIIWEGNEEKESKKFTYKQLLDEVCKCANVLKSKGVKRGDCVSIYMPMVPELAISMLACARIGAVHSIVFGGFSAEALRDRMLDSESTFLITTDGALRGKKDIPMKKAADEAMRMCEEAGKPVKTCLVDKRTGEKTQMKEGRDWWWSDVMKDAAAECAPEKMNAEDPLFILYTSGSTGKPKGVLHTTGGYMVYAGEKTQ